MSHNDSITPGRSYGGQTPEQRSSRRREQFISAGRVLIGTEGYRKTTVKALCREAGLTDRYFYESFSSMEDLLIAVYEDVIAEMQASLLTALQMGDGKSLHEVIDGALEIYFLQVQDPLKARIVWLEVLGISARVDAVYNHCLRHFAQLLMMVARQMRPELTLDDETAAVVSMGAIGALSETAKDWLLNGYEQPRAQMVKGSSLLLRSILQTM